MIFFHITPSYPKKKKEKKNRINSCLKLLLTNVSLYFYLSFNQIKFLDIFLWQQLENEKTNKYTSNWLQNKCNTVIYKIKRMLTNIRHCKRTTFLANKKIYK